jgi:hypothetical protein
LLVLSTTTFVDFFVGQSSSLTVWQLSSNNIRYITRILDFKEISCKTREILLRASVLFPARSDLIYGLKCS